MKSNLSVLKSAMRVTRIPLESIEQNENSRAVYKSVDLSTLMESMKQHGLLQPVGVRRLQDGKYEAIFGNRRILAARKLGWKYIDAAVTPIDNDAEMLIKNLVENFQRQNTTAEEDGRIFLKLEELGLTNKEIAARVGVSQTRVETALEVLKQIPKEYRSKILNGLRGSVPEGAISATTAATVLTLKSNHNLNSEQTTRLLDLAMKPGTSYMKLQCLAPLMQQGASLSSAIRNVKKLKKVNLTFFMDKEEAARLERKHGKRIGQVLLDRLSQDSSLGIYEASNRVSYKSKPDGRRMASK